MFGYCARMSELFFEFSNFFGWLLMTLQETGTTIVCFQAANTDNTVSLTNLSLASKFFFITKYY